MTNLEMIKTMPIGGSWIFSTNVDGKDMMIAVHRHAVGFQIQTMCDESDIQKWLHEGCEEQKGE